MAVRQWGHWSKLEGLNAHRLSVEHPASDKGFERIDLLGARGLWRRRSWQAVAPNRIERGSLLLLCHEHGQRRRKPDRCGGQARLVRAVRRVFPMADPAKAECTEINRQARAVAMDNSAP